LGISTPLVRTNNAPALFLAIGTRVVYESKKNVFFILFFFYSFFIGRFRFFLIVYNIKVAATAKK
jgi:hypothetical protein